MVTRLEQELPSVIIVSSRLISLYLRINSFQGDDILLVLVLHQRILLDDLRKGLRRRGSDFSWPRVRLSGEKVFPWMAVISRSGLKELKSEMTSSWNPLKTERTMIRAMVPTVTPATETPEMMLITLCDFRETRYRFAIYTGKFNIWIVSPCSGLFPCFDDQPGAGIMVALQIHIVNSRSATGKVTR